MITLEFSFNTLLALGVILLLGGSVFFLCVFAYSWFAAKPRRFLGVCLHYDDKETQGLVRVFWLLAWGLSFIGALILAYNDPRISHQFWVILIGICCYMVVAFLNAKIVMTLFIIIQYIFFGVSYIKKWCFDDKALAS